MIQSQDGLGWETAWSGSLRRRRRTGRGRPGWETGRWSVGGVAGQQNPCQELIDQYEDFSVHHLPVHSAREFTQALSTSKKEGPLKL